MTASGSMDLATDGSGTDGNRTVARTAALLSVLHERGGRARLSVLGAALDIPRSSLYDLIRPLIAAAWLEKLPDGHIGHSILSVPRIADIERLLQKSADDCHGVVALYAADDGETIALAVRAAKDAPHLRLHAGDRRPPNWSLPGRMLASPLAGRQLDYFISAYAQRMPGHPPQSVEKMAAEIAQLRGERIVVKTGEPEHHLTTCALALTTDSTVRAVVGAIVTPDGVARARASLDRLDDKFARDFNSPERGAQSTETK